MSKVVMTCLRQHLGDGRAGAGLLRGELPVQVRLRHHPQQGVRHVLQVLPGPVCQHLRGGPQTGENCESSLKLFTSILSQSQRDFSYF